MLPSERDQVVAHGDQSVELLALAQSGTPAEPYQTALSHCEFAPHETADIDFLVALTFSRYPPHAVRDRKASHSTDAAERIEEVCRARPSILWSYEGLGRQRCST
jgi:hypothetical protein